MRRIEFPSRRGFAGGRRQQRGMALLIALIVLVVVSILGAVAMRTAMFQNRVSINSQTANLAFEAAESGLGAAMYIATVVQTTSPIDDANHIFNRAVNVTGQRVCFTDTAVPTFDEKTEVDADGGYTYSEPCPVLANSNARTTTVVDGNAEEAVVGTDILILKHSLVRVRATAEVPNTNIRTTHVQEWAVLSPGGTPQ